MKIQQTNNLTSSGLNAEPVVKQDVPVQSPKARSAPVNEGEVAQAVQPTQQELSPTQLHNAVEQVNKTIQTLSKDVEFSVDKDTGKYVVKVVNSETKEVIRQIPSEEVLAIAKRLDELQGLIIRQKA